MNSYSVLCYMVGASNLAPLSRLVIRADNAFSASFRAFQQGAQEVISITLL